MKIAFSFLWCEMDNITYFKRLVLALKESKYTIFPNQTIVYRALALLSADQIVIRQSRKRINTDQLIEEMKKYVFEASRGDKNENYVELHNQIVEILTNNEVMKGSTVQSSIKILNGAINQSLKINVSQIINGKKHFSENWQKSVKDSQDYGVFVYRIFWICQYFISYYSKPEYKKEVHIISSRRPYCGPYELTDDRRLCLFNSLKKYCIAGSALLEKIQYQDFTLRALSKIFFDIILMHCREVECKKALTKFEEQREPHREKQKEIVLDSEIEEEYQRKVGIYDNNTVDWLHMCSQYASHNYVAMSKLADLYYAGGTFYSGEIFAYEVKKDYSKAIKLYQKAIESSTVPYQPACWNLGNLLAENYKIVNKKLIDPSIPISYFDMAGNFAPAYNSKAKWMIISADDFFDLLVTEKGMSIEEAAQKVCMKYVNALQLAYRASEMNWLYGNNVIADFIIKHRDSKEGEYILQEVAEHVNFPRGMDVKFFLNRSVQYKNPWALHMLAQENIREGNLENAKILLEHACALNYYPAFADMAVHYCVGKRQKWLLWEASKHGSGLATFEYAIRFAESESQMNGLIEKAVNQIYSFKVIDMKTLIRITEYDASRF